MQRALLMHPDCEVVFFLGDGLSDIEELIGLRKSVAWIAVKGNCDGMAELCDRAVKKTEEITLLGKKIVLTHGDIYGAKAGGEGLLRLAEATDADLLLFGHTHRAFNKYYPDASGGVYLFNPGTVGGVYEPMSYGVIEITDRGILLSHCQ